MEFTSEQKKKIDLYFRLSVFLKGVISLLEVIAGFLAFFIPVSAVTNFIIYLAQGELIEDPHSFIATHVVALAQQFSLTGGTFLAVYLLSRGLIKLLLIIALLKNQLWAYPSSLVVLGLFVFYQLYQYFISFSVLLLALTAFDLVVMWFIWREYEVVRLLQAKKVE